MDGSSNLVVVYKRISQEKSGGLNSLGIEAQKMELDAVIKREGLKVIGEFVHVASASRKKGHAGENQKELLKAIAMAKRANATLLVAKVDRAARDLEFFIREILNSGVNFRALNCPNAFGANGRLFLQQLAIFAEWESNEISRRTKAGIAASKARGTYHNPRVYILTKEDTARGRATAAKGRREQAKKEYRDLIDEICELRLKGLTLNKIAEHLNNHNQRTRTGKLFNGKTILNILTYFGKQDCGFGVVKYRRGTSA